MRLEISAESNTTGTVKLYCNTEKIWTHTGHRFSADLDIKQQEKNVLDLHWNCLIEQEGISLQVKQVLLNDQKIDIYKTMYMPFSAPSGYNDYISHHCGNLVWPGILRIYFQVIQKEQYRLKKINDSTMFRKYNIIYD